ncbi:MAG: hypothetical protein ABI378_01100 [Chitinophagaceae bacterium]
MRSLTLLLFLLLSFGQSFGQQIHRLAGYVQMPGEPLMSYYVQFMVKGKEVTGYTVTDYKQGNRLKATLVGKYVTPSDLWIAEKGSLDGDSRSGMTYCYFSAHLKLSVANGRERWTGQFESYQENGFSCGGGFMSIIDDAPPLDFSTPKMTARNVEVPTVRKVPHDTVKKSEPVILKPIPKDTLKVLTPAKKPEIVAVIHLPEARSVTLPQGPPDSNACARSYTWTADSLSFDIWDGWTVDGDVVSVAFNGSMLLDNEKLSGVKKHFSLPLRKGDNTLIVYLHAEGFEPPNTPNLILFDGTKKYELGISGNSGEKVRICFEKK